MPVNCVMKYGILQPGLTNDWNLLAIFRFFTLTIPISITRFSQADNPVVSTSKTENSTCSIGTDGTLSLIMF